MIDNVPLHQLHSNTILSREYSTRKFRDETDPTDVGLARSAFQTTRWIGFLGAEADLKTATASYLVITPNFTSLCDCIKFRKFDILKVVFMLQLSGIFHKQEFLGSQQKSKEDEYQR